MRSRFFTIASSGFSIEENPLFRHQTEKVAPGPGSATSAFIKCMSEERSASNHFGGKTAMPCQYGVKRDGSERVILHHHSSFYDQGFNASGGTEHQSRRHIFHPAVTHVAEVKQRNVRALARGEPSNVIAAQAFRSSHRRHVQRLACLDGSGAVGTTI